MDSSGSFSEGLYDPTKGRVPRRFRNKMPSLTHLKTYPCVPLWEELVTCYTLFAFDQNRCTAQVFAYEECKRTTVRRSELKFTFFFSLFPPSHFFNMDSFSLFSTPSLYLLAYPLQYSQELHGEGRKSPKQFCPSLSWPFLAPLSFHLSNPLLFSFSF